MMPAYFPALLAFPLVALAEHVCDSSDCGSEGDETMLLQSVRDGKLQQHSQDSYVHGFQQDAQWGGSKEPCATLSYKAKYVLPKNAEQAGMAPPMLVGNSTNMDPALKQLGLDFEGIWWMRGNPVPEELASFANTKINASSFPVQLSVFNNEKGKWSWDDNLGGQGLVKYYSAYDPKDPSYFIFDNTTNGHIKTGLTDVPLVWVDRWPFVYMNKDEWLRPTIFQDRSLFPDTNYTLTRIIMGDGSPHPVFWPKFLDHMTPKHWFSKGKPGDYKMISFQTDNFCMRKCQIATLCSICRLVCR